MAIEIRQVTDPEELQAIYRFRYDVYVTEMNRVQRYADHRARTIIDPLDATAACVIGAFEHGKVVGTVRTNFVRKGVGEYFELYRLKDFFSLNVIRLSSITSRMMVSEKFRNSLLGLKIFVAIYEFGLSTDIEHDFIDANENRLAIFKKLGYEEYLPNSTIDHPEYGQVTPMFLNLRSLTKLQDVGSPFSRILRNSFSSRLTAEEA